MTAKENSYNNGWGGTSNRENFSGVAEQHIQISAHVVGVLCCPLHGLVVPQKAVLLSFSESAGVQVSSQSRDPATFLKTAAWPRGGPTGP